VFINWIYNYITYDQSLRLIFKEFYRPRIPVEKTKQPSIVGNVPTTLPGRPEQKGSDSQDELRQAANFKR
jgi:hypothetical protein